MTSEAQSTDQQLRGILGNVQKRAAMETVYDEFHPLVDFKVEKRIMPPLSPVTGQRTLIELRVGSSYCVFRDDDGETMLRAERSAMRLLCRCLYEDVQNDLAVAIKAVGDGKRALALSLLESLYVRLDGRE